MNIEAGTKFRPFLSMHSLTLPIFALNIVRVSWFLEIGLGI